MAVMSASPAAASPRAATAVAYRAEAGSAWASMATARTAAATAAAATSPAAVYEDQLPSGPARPLAFGADSPIWSIRFCMDSQTTE
jgi:hypothetical protein